MYEGIPKRKQIAIVCFLIVLTICTFLMMSLNGSVVEFDSIPSNGILRFLDLLYKEISLSETNSIIAIFVPIIYASLLFKNRGKKDNVALIVSIILSILFVVGYSFSIYHSFAFLFTGICQFIIALIVFIGICPILYILLKFLFDFLHNKKQYMDKTIVFGSFLERNYKIVVLIILVLSWLPIIICFFPGSIPYDGKRQLEMYFGYQTFTRHHPYFSTMLFGVIYQLGKTVFNENAIFLLIIIQFLFALYVYHHVCVFVKEKTNIVLGFLCAVFYGLNPVFPSFIQAVMKDGIYMIAFTWYALLFYKILIDEGSNKDIIQLFFAGFLTCVMRNNGIYIVIPSGFFLLLKKKKDRKPLTVSFCLVFFMSWIFNTGIPELLSIPEGPTVEMMSVPLQQIARYVHERENDITEEDIKIINNIIKYEDISERYNPENADPVKTFYRNSRAEDWIRFFGLWIGKFQKEPLIFIEGAVNHMFGYFYPTYYYRGLSIYPLYIKGKLNDQDKSEEYAQYYFPDGFRSIMQDYIYLWDLIPVFSLFVTPGFYTWIVIICIAYLLKYKYKYSFIFYLLPALSIMVCFISPVNGYLRYMLPVTSILPLMIIDILNARDLNEGKSANSTVLSSRN